jgi:hypothetical protein
MSSAFNIYRPAGYVDGYKLQLHTSPISRVLIDSKLKPRTSNFEVQCFYAFFSHIHNQTLVGVLCIN